MCEKYIDGVTHEYRDKEFHGHHMFESNAGVDIIMVMSEIIGACRSMKGIIAVQVINAYGVGMIALDKDCKVYYIGSFGKDELCKQGMPDEFKI